jgi:hypothetical protein
MMLIKCHQIGVGFLVLNSVFEFDFVRDLDLKSKVVIVSEIVIEETIFFSIPRISNVGAYFEIIGYFIRKTRFSKV